MAFNWPTEELTVSGRVGVGTDTPSKELDVIGDISATNLNLSGTIQANSFEGNGSNLTGLVTTSGDSTIDGSLTINENLAVSGHLQFTTGLAINEFSSDGNLIDNSNSAIPTEQAVKTYVDNQISQLNDALDTKAALNGAADQDFTAQNLTVGRNLRVSGDLEVKGNVIARDTEHIEGNVSLGNEDSDVITITGVVSSGHSSDALQVNSGLHTTGSLSVDDSLTVSKAISTPKLSVTDRVIGSLAIENNLTVGGSLTTSGVNATGTIQANRFEGDGSALTGINAGKWSDGSSGSIYYNNGNVGIGTTTPAKKLEVTGEIQANGIIRATDGFRPATDDWEIARNGEDLEIREPEQTNKVWARFKDDTSLHLIGTPHLWVDGNVGIGTTAPTHKFHVKSGNAVGLLESTGNQAYLRLSTNEGLNNRVEITNRPGGRLSLWTAGAGDVFNITRSGNVGIGTIQPTEKLEVNGTIKAQEVQGKGTLTAFVSYDGRSRIIRNGFNVASVSRVGTGRYDIRWSVRTNAHGPFACWTWGTGGGVRVGGRGSSSTLLQVNVYGANAQLVDDSIMVMVAS